MALISGSQLHSSTELRYCSRGPHPVSGARGTQLDPHLNIPLLLGLVNYGWFANTLPPPATLALSCLSPSIYLLIPPAS